MTTQNRKYLTMEGFFSLVERIKQDRETIWEGLSKNQETFTSLSAYYNICKTTLKKALVIANAIPPDYRTARAKVRIQKSLHPVIIELCILVRAICEEKAICTRKLDLELEKVKAYTDTVSYCKPKTE